MSTLDIDFIKKYNIISQKHIDWLSKNNIKHGRCIAEKLILLSVDYPTFNTVIKDYYKEYPEQINNPGTHNMTAIMFATLLNNFEIVEFLCRHGANVNVHDTQYWFTLHYAFRHRSVSAVKMLLEYDAQILFNTNGRHPFNLFDYEREEYDKMVDDIKMLNVKN